MLLNVPYPLSFRLNYPIQTSCNIWRLWQSKSLRKHTHLFTKMISLNITKLQYQIPLSLVFINSIWMGEDTKVKKKMTFPKGLILLKTLGSFERFYINTFNNKLLLWPNIQIVLSKICCAHIFLKKVVSNLIGSPEFF